MSPVRLSLCLLAALLVGACSKSPPPASEPPPAAPPQPPAAPPPEPTVAPPADVRPAPAAAPVNPSGPVVTTKSGYRLRLVDDTVSTTKDAVALEVVPPVGPGRVVLEVALVAADGAVRDTRKIEGVATTIAPLGMALELAELPLLRFRVTPAGGAPEVIALTRLRPPLGLEAILPSTLLAGGPVALRLVTRHLASGALAAGASVEVTLDGASLGTAKTDDSGTLEATFTVPDGAGKPEGSQLSVTARSDDGAVARLQGPVTVRRERRMLLSTDKPLYQPGQVIHVRGLAMKRPENTPVSGEEALFEVTDPKGNKVFKHRMPTTVQGVAHARFELANELILGRYRVRFAVGDTEVERTIDIQRYTLPKFKVSATPAKPFYRPGDTVEGSVEARYFFGKAVSGKVEVQLETFDVGWSLAGTAQGELDATGRFTFALPLPTTLVAQPLADWKAMTRVTAKVVDSAGQDEVTRAELPVVPASARVDLVVAGQRLVVGATNEVWVLVTSPDGRPIPGAKVTVSHGPSPVSVVTGPNGAAEVELVGAGGGALSARVVLPSGEEILKSVDVTAVDGVAVILTPARVALKVGETLSTAVRVTGKSPAGRAFVDLVRDGQTLLTRSVPLVSGTGELEVALGPDHVGTLLLHAYVIGDDMTVVRDTRPILVTDARELKVSRVATDPKPFAPGEEATLTLAVTDPGGQAVPNAALGVSIVDEAVFALASADAGLLGLFMALEKELLTPKIEVHAACVDDLHAEDTREHTVRVLGAARPVGEPGGAMVSTARLAAEAVRAAFLGGVLADARRVHDAWVGFTAATPGSFERLVVEKLGTPLVDAWDQPYRLEVDGEGDKITGFRLRSLGPDAVAESADDLVVSSADIEAEKRKQLEELTAKLEARQVFRGGFDMAGAAEAAPMAAFATGGGGALHPSKPQSSTGAAPVRVRQYFPETLYVNPLVLTGDDGRAELKLTMADSITSWRMSVTASDAQGRLGSGRSDVVVFQDFFVDLDVPESLTRGDEVSVPVAVYNYLDGEQTVTLTLELGEAFELVGAGLGEPMVLEKGAVRGTSFRVRARTVGRQPLTVTARGATLSDAVRREVRVVPDGVESVATKSGALDGEIKVETAFPENAIPGGNGLFVKLFPGSFSQVVDGLDAIFQMPSGCFEQTSSTTYPNILALDYLRQTAKDNPDKAASPEVEAKALSYLNQGWQRLLTFEVAGGGFSWFGDAPANKVLTAFGVQEFAAMNRVFEIDRAVLDRTRAWLLAQQEPDGSWKPDASFLHAENWGDIQKGSLLVTAFIARALAVSADDGGDPELDKALSWLAARTGEAKDAYTLALIGGAFAARGRSEATAVLEALAALAVKSEDGKSAHWPAGVRTAVYGQDRTANIETTALAAIAFMTAKQHMGLVRGALSWLATEKDASGTWHATMPTVLALTALVQAITDSQETVSGDVQVMLDGAVVETLSITPDNSDVFRLVDLSTRATAGEHTVSLRLQGQGSPSYQVVSRHFTPPGVTAGPFVDAFLMNVTYDKRALAADDTVTAEATVKSMLGARSEMVVLDLGVPPGFSVVSEDLDAMIQAEKIEKYTVAGRQLIVYLDHLDAGATVALSYRLRAKVPLRAQTGPSRVYEYYTPSRKGAAGSAVLEVTE